MGGITQAINVAKEDFSQKLYFKEDIERLIIKLCECIKKNATDTEQTVRSKIIRMFAAYGIKLEKTLTPEQYREQLELYAIQSVKEFPRMCWTEMMKFNLVYKTPKEYMERLVNELVSPEYDSPDSPIRVKILKQILGKLDCLRGTRFQSKKLIDIIENDYDGLISNIGDEIFENNLSPKHYMLPHKYLRALLDVYKEVLYVDDERDDYLTGLVVQYDDSAKGKTAKELLKIIRDNNPEEKKIIKGQKEEIKKIYNILNYSESLLNDIKEHLDYVLEKYKKDFDVAVKTIKAEKSRDKQFELIIAFIARRNLSEYAYTEEFLTLVEQQLKIRSCDYGTYEELCKELSKIAKAHPRSFAKINQYLIKQINDFMKEKNAEFRDAKSRNKDKDESVPEILYICDDLAEGRYKANSKMKEILYLFAFAFDMSISFENEKEKTIRDVKKSLFEDFYCDNIIRYVNDYQLNGVYDEPTGITIQFKNFVEIVYLYWLNKDSGIVSPAEKYLSANAMIKKVVSKIKSAEKDIEKSTTRTVKKYFEAKKLAEKKALGTYVYRNFVKTDSEYGDESLRIDNFLSLPEEEFLKVILDNYDVDTKIKYTSSEAFENESYQEIAASNFVALIDELKNGFTGGGLGSNCYSLEFYETVFEDLFANKEYDIDSHKRLSSLVKKINEQMKQVLIETEADDYCIFTRTRYMYLYYNNFIQSHIGEKYTETFDDFYDEYCEQLNIDLESCSYQLFSEKNLIDIMLLYSAFITLRTEDN